MSPRIATCEECTAEFEAAQHGYLPKLCATCKAEKKVKPIKKKAKAVKRFTTRAPALLSPLDVIDQFNLDYNVGNAVRYLLELGDGDRMENLTTAQQFLERAIARQSREAA